MSSDSVQAGPPLSAEPAESESAARSMPAARSRLIYLAEAYALLALTLLLIGVFSLLPSTRGTFPTIGNIQATLGNQAVLTIIAVGAVLPLVAGAYDFSVGANMGLSSVLAGKALATGASVSVGLLVAAGTGLAIGLTNGLLVTRARVNSVIATLGMAAVISGLVSWVTGGQAIVNGIPASLGSFGAATFLDIPLPVYVAIAVSAVVYFVLGHTTWGRYTHGAGSNPAAARLVGINVRRVTLSTFVLGGMLAGAAGMIEIARIGVANPQVGPDFTVPAIAAAFLSVAAIKPGTFNVGGILVAILFLGALNSGMNLAGVNSYVNNIANGIALIAGVALAGFFGRDRRGAES